ncbi:MAG: UDP-glucose 4-epimerase [Candidatus Altiarchaeales archaeon WOR_SM1_86-2]|nr:MAG: UDP-glucose 4-epimerase [Candidatus Altiarchaeales archaeon WOR_SM1_86-2]
MVTGGAGFIGGNLVERLVRDGYGVRVIDDLSTGKIENLEGVEGIDFIEGDIRNFDYDILDDVEVVFHQAAQIDVRKSVDDPKYDLDVNVGGTINLLEGVLKSGVKKIVYASSGGACYGDPKCLPADETHPTDPISPYGASKLSAEKYIRIYSENYGLSYAILRYGNVYGPKQDPLGEAGVIAIFLNRILNDRKPVIYGDGHQTRDYVHVADVVESNLLAANKDTRHKIFNVGTGIETSVNRLVEIISDVLGKKVVPEHTKERKGEVRRICLDISLARKELGFEPEMNLREGIGNVLEWMRR